MRIRNASLAAVTCVCAWLGFVACSGSSGVLICGEIPEGGCSLGRGGSCDDTVCVALYDCLEGNWTEVISCDANVGGGGAGGAGGGGGAGGCQQVIIDRSGEQSGCSPDLQTPDCHAFAAEACRPCNTGCEDFFLCLSDGWTAVAHCNQDGQIELDR